MDVQIKVTLQQASATRLQLAAFGQVHLSWFELVDSFSIDMNYTRECFFVQICLREKLKVGNLAENLKPPFREISQNEFLHINPPGWPLWDICLLGDAICRAQADERTQRELPSA